MGLIQAHFVLETDPIWGSSCIVQDCNTPGDFEFYQAVPRLVVQNFELWRSHAAPPY